MRFDWNDFGIIFRGSTSPGQTYVDIWGKEREAVLLTPGAELFMDAAIESAVFHVGAASRFSLECSADVSGGDTMEVRLHGELANAAVDETSPVLQTARNDTGISAGVQTIAESSRVILQTANLSSITNAAIGITYEGSEIEGTDITIRLRVLA